MLCRFLGSWKAKDDRVEITLTARGEFQIDMNHGDGTMTKKGGEWFPYHTNKGNSGGKLNLTPLGIVLNVYEKKEIRGLPVESPKLPEVKKKKQLSSNSDSDYDSESTSSDYWDDAKGKGKEKEKLDPEKQERKRIERARKGMPSKPLVPTMSDRKWVGTNEVFLITEGNSNRTGGKPFFINLWNELIVVEESEDKNHQELYPSFPIMPPAVVRREMRENALKDQKRNTASRATYVPYAVELKQLADMGFTGPELSELLAQYDGNVANVVNRLLG